MSDEILIRFRSDLAEMRKELADVKEKISDTGKAAENAGKTTNAAMDGLKNTLKSVGSMIAGAFAVEQLISFGKESVQLANQARGIETAFAKLNNPTLLKDLRNATQGAVSDIQLMQAAVKFNNFKLPLENLATYMRFVNQRATETGESIDYMMDSLVEGLSKDSLLRIDNLGIKVADMRKQMDKGATTAEALATLMKEQLGDVGANAINQSTASWENLKVAVGKTIIEGIEPFIEMSGGAIDVLTQWLSGTLDVADANHKLNDELKNNPLFNMKGSESLKFRINLLKAQADNVESLGGSAFKLRQEINKLETEYDKLTKKEKEIIDNRKDLIAIQEKELEMANLMPGRTEKEVAARNRKIKTIEDEIKRLKELGLANDKLYKKQQEIRNQINADEVEADKYEDQRFKDDIASIDTETKAVNDAANKQKGIWEKKEKELEYLDKQREEAHLESLDKMTEATQEELAVREALLKAYEDVSRALVDRAFAERQRQRDDDLDNELSALEKQRNAEINSKERTESEIARINAKYDAKAKKIKQDKWRKDKNEAILRTNINIAGAVMKAYFTEGYYGAIAAAIAGAAQLAIIASQPEPKFHEGEIDIRPEGKRRLKNGEFKATLIEGESVIKPEATRKYAQELQAINDLKFDELLLKKYILPVLEEKTEKSRTTGENMINNIRLQQYNGSNVVEMLMRVNATSRENTAILATALKQFKRDYRHPQ